MTIDEAITHAREVSSRKFDDRVHCIRCSEFHKQIAEWLEELKMLRELKDEHRKIGNIEGFNKGYDKAIDDFAEKLIRYVYCGHLCSPTEVRWSDLSVVEMVKELAEQLKAGGENE